MGADLSPLLRADVSTAVGPYTLTVPWRTAREWISALNRSSSAALLYVAEPSDVAVGLAAGSVTVTDLEDGTFQAMKGVTGLEWYVALRLVYTSVSPSFLGELTLSGVDPDRVGLGEWCAAVYRILTRNADPKEVVKIDFELELPPPGYEEAWDDDAYYAKMVEDARKMNQG